MRSKGINGIKRNLFAENVLDKLRQEIEKLAKKELVKKEVCPKHKEEENLVRPESIQSCSKMSW